MRTDDIERSGPMNKVRLVVTQTVRAESLGAKEVLSGEAARVLTGGIVPPGANGVLAEEDVEIDEDAIKVSTPIRQGWFVRPAGGEIAKGAIILRAGEIVTPQAAAVMMRTGVKSIHAYPRPTAWTIALGSELTDPTQLEEEGEGRFPADNLVLTGGLLYKSGAEVEFSGVLPDEEERLIGVLSSEDLPDVIITTGGTGRSERDFAHSSAQQAGFTTIFDRLDIRPGRNMFAAHKGNTLLFCLPGPPTAVFACYHAVVLPIIRMLRGLQNRPAIMAKLENGISARPGGHWLFPCRLTHKGTGLVATPLAGKEVPPMLAIGQAHGAAIVLGGNSILPDGEVEILSTLFE
jgi:molybdopterin molybdotransferase